MVGRRASEKRIFKELAAGLYRGRMGTPSPPGISNLREVVVRRHGIRRHGHGLWLDQLQHLDCHPSQCLSLVGVGSTTTKADIDLIPAAACRNADHPQQSVAVQIPTQVVVDGTQVQGAAVCPSGQAGWSRTINGLLVDQFVPQQPIRTPGITMAESIASPQPNALGITQYQTGQHTTDASGHWPDTYFVCSSVCINQSGQTNASQSWTANSFNLPWINAVQYTCSSITIDGQ